MLGEDSLDDLRLGVGVVLYIAPVVRSQGLLGARVFLPEVLVRAQEVTEADHSLDLDAVRTEHVDIRCRIPVAQQPVLEPVRFS